jgi:hypothetical protein
MLLSLIWQFASFPQYIPPPVLVLQNKTNRTKNKQTTLKQGAM